MFTFSPAQIGVVLLCCAVFKFGSVLWRNRQFKKFAAAHGCGEPFDISGRGPLAFLDGWRRLRRVLVMQTTGEDILDDIFADQFKHTTTPRQTQFEGSVVLGTIEPANIQAMLATQFKDFGIGQRRVNQFYPVLGNSIFSSDGSSWEHSRSLFRPQFNREQINDLEETEDACRALIDALGPVDSAGWTKGTELLPLLYNFTLDTATSFLFGESVGSQRLVMGDGGEHDSIQQARITANKQFTEDFELASRYMLFRIRNASLYWLADGLQFRQATARIRRFTEQFVRRAVEPASPSKAGGKKYNLLSALATQTQDKTELRNQTLAILVAGRDTTAALLAWCFTRLALHPDIFEKLRSTILRDFRRGEEINFTKLKGCRYLQHFLHEVLRLHPTVPVNNRTAVRDTTLPAGGGADGSAPVAVFRGQVVTFSVYLMHRRRDLWGEDALHFRPERWEQQQQQQQQRRFPAWQFLPFSGGPRICLGQQFALVEASYVTVRMLQHFDAIEPVDRAGLAKLKKGLGLTMWPATSNVRFHKA